MNDPSRSAPIRDQFFSELLERYSHRNLLSSDPAQFMHNYSNTADQEIAAFISALFAYGSAQQINKALASLFTALGPSPSRFIRNYDGSLTNHTPLDRFYYRFHKPTHLNILFLTLKHALQTFGTLENLFNQGSNLREGLESAAAWLDQTSEEWLRLKKASELRQGMRFFFNSPRNGSACKRMNMFLRWMIRKDEIDLGLWKGFSPSDLIIPVDTHIARLSYYLRLRSGKEQSAPNWAMAVEITESLKKFSPNDPVQFDFALSRLGILKLCKKKYVKNICAQCPVATGCRHSNSKNRALDAPR